MYSTALTRGFRAEGGGQRATGSRTKHIRLQRLAFRADAATLSRMRGETNRAKLERLMAAIGEHVSGSGVVYLTGGATALLFGWRESTIDVDIKPDPEPPGLFQAIATLKESLDLNIELASPDQFIPTLPRWRDRSIFIATYGPVSFYHYDLYSQALSKLQRGHARDVRDVEAMRSARLIEPEILARLFREIQPQLIRYPSIDAPTFERVVREFCGRDDA